MREVSCRLLDLLFRQLKKEGKEPALLAQGTDYDIPHLQNRNERIEWSAFVQIMRNAESIWTPEELVRMGQGFFSNPVIRSFMAPARLLMSPRRLYRFVLGESGGFGKNLVPSAQNHYEEVGSGEATLALTFPEHYEYSPGYFLVTQGAISGLPRALGLETASVSMSRVPGGAKYRILFPPDSGFLAGVRKLFAWPFMLRAVATEAEQAKQVMLEQYRQLEEARDKLELRVRERTAELEAARDELRDTVTQLERAQTARKRFFSNINHEIRTPLSLIRLSAKELETSHRQTDPDSAGLLDEIVENTRVLMQLVDGLLLLAAGDEGDLKLQRVPLDVGELLQSIRGSWTLAARESGVSLRVEVSDEAVATLDKLAFERVIGNLLSNSMKFTPSGGTIVLGVRRDDSTCVVWVQDDGVGIAPDAQKRIFERFEQDKSALRSFEQGTGIGLAIVRELVEAHEGSISLQSNEGEGSTFTIRIPLTELPAVDADSNLESRPSAAALPKRQPTVQNPSDQQPANPDAVILVAEDDPGMRRAIVRLLQKRYFVYAAANGADALALAEAHKPDLLVTDVGMPEMDGLELTRRFRELEGNRLAPVLVLTAFGDSSLRQEGFQAGAIDYLTKPFEPEELAARVAAQLSVRSVALGLLETEKHFALGVLSQGLAHELRNPINGIVNALGPLQRTLPEGSLKDDSPSKALFDVLQVCASQLSSLTKDLGGLGREDDLRQSEISVDDWIGNALTIARSQYQKVRFEYEADSTTAALYAAQSLIVTALSAILDNAAQSAGDDGRVWITASCKDTDVTIDVSDTGPGIPPELQERIFEPFFTTKDPGEGTGLGLALARRIIHRHGGTVRVINPGTQSAVRISLPIVVSASPG